MDTTIGKPANRLTEAPEHPAGSTQELQQNNGAPGVQSKTQATSLLSTQGQPEAGGSGAQLTSAPVMQAAAASDSDEQGATADEADGGMARLREQAEHGDAQAQFELGQSLVGGAGLEQDRVQGVEWLSKAAQQGYVKAQSVLGLKYYLGNGVESDEGQAFKWLSEAARNGVAAAQSHIGHMYLKGQHVKKNPQRAFEWLSKAAQQGDGPAHALLSKMYRKGIYVERNPEKAVQHLMQWSGWGEQGITYLEFQRCDIDDDMLAIIASRMQNDQAIETLNLSRNLITDAGAAKLARMLEQNATLRTLDLENNPIGQPGLKAIGDAMRSNTTVKRVFFTLPIEASRRMRVEGDVIEAEAEANMRILRMLDEQQAWQAGAERSNLPLEVASLLEQSLIRADIKLRDSTDEATMQRLLEVQLCLSRL